MHAGELSDVDAFIGWTVTRHRAARSTSGPFVTWSRTSSMSPATIASRLGADITVMVWVDGGHDLIGRKQDQELGRHADLSFGNPDWFGLAECFGWHGQYVERSRNLAGAIDAALAHRGTRLVAMPVYDRENMALGERLGALEISI